MTDAEWQYQWDQKCLRLEQENERLKAELEKAQKSSYARMMMLRAFRKSMDSNLPFPSMEKLNELINDDCGKDYFTKPFIDACKEAWNAFENGKRKHHTDALTGKCILGCQLCAIQKLKQALAHAKEIGIT